MPSVGGIAAGDAKDGGGWEIGEGAAEAGGLETEAVEARPGHGAEWAVGELVEGSSGLHAAEGSAQEGEDAGRREVEERQAADDGSDGVLGEEVAAVEVASVHLQDAGSREALTEKLSELRAGFDEGEVAFADALVEERLGEDAGTGAEFDDGAGVAADFAGDEACEGRAGGRDGANLGGVRADGPQKGERVLEVSFGPLDVGPVDEGPIHVAGSIPRGWRD